MRGLVYSDPLLFCNNYILNQEVNIFRNKDNEPLKCCSCKYY